jgi:TrmH family RNA methyltransferase
VYEILSSPHNPLLKEVRKALSQGALTRQGWCIAEGPHLVDEAERSGCVIPRLLGTRERLAPYKDRLHCVEVPVGLLASVTATESPQGLIALVDPPAATRDQVFVAPALVLALDGVQDPGNAGALVRAAEAFGATGVLFLKGTVNPWNPKTVRASAGSLFRVPVLAGWNAAEAIEACRAHHLELWAALPEKGATECDLRRSCALFIGGEGSGVNDTVRRAALPVRIPTRGVESLNAAVAGAILLYEAARQRGAR